MRKRKIIYVALFILLIIVVILAAIIFNTAQKSLSVNFLDVGQGDAILISQGNKQILIDGGPSGQKIMEKLGQYVPFWDRKIEVVIESHPDQDHIEGLLEVMRNYQVGEIILSKGESDSELYKKFKEIISEKNIDSLTAEKGMEIKIADDIPLKIISAEEGNANDTNSASVVVKLIFGENTFLFIGDLPEGEEKKLVEEKADLASQVLKFAHHGSKYSTSGEFLGAVNTRDAVISVAKNNKYGHPAEETLNRLKEKNINILRTDESGDIRYDCQNIQEICFLIAN